MKNKIKKQPETGQDNKTWESAELFHEHLRQSVRCALQELMWQEVEQLCGARYERGVEREHRRAGSEAGVFYRQGGKETIERPRVRRKSSSGEEKEVALHSYQRARSPQNIESEIFERMSEGVSTRGCGRLSGQSISASTASGLWVEGSLRQLEELRGRDLSQESFLGLMVDGVYLGRELVVVVALGITCTGEKRVLDFTVGSTESSEVVKGLLVRLQRRGLTTEGRLLAILDGAQALRKAVKELWPDALIQSCVIHKERNLHRYLRQSDHGECSRLLRRLREGQGEQAGREALQALRQFLSSRNAAALASLEEAGEDLITLHLLNAPATLHPSLLSTNVIENAILNYRRQTERVTRWQPQTNQVDRWSATALLWLEKGFRKIKGHADLPKLRLALARPAPAGAGVTGSPLRGVPTPSGTPSTPAPAESSLTSNP